MTIIGIDSWTPDRRLRGKDGLKFNTESTYNAHANLSLMDPNAFPLLALRLCEIFHLTQISYIQKFVSLNFTVCINMNPPGRRLRPEYVSTH